MQFAINVKVSVFVQICKLFPVENNYIVKPALYKQSITKNPEDIPYQKKKKSFCTRFVHMTLVKHLSKAT